MKKFLTQQINFAYALIVMLTLTIGVAFVGAAVAPDDSGPNTISPLIHVGGGEQAISGLRIGTCSGGSCLGKFDVRGNLQNISLFDTIEGLSPLFLVIQNVGVSQRLFVGPDAGPNTPIWTETYGSGPSRFSVPLQATNVFGNARATNLSNTSPNAPVCVDREGVLKLCTGGMIEPTKINGSCGTSHGGNFSEPPTTNLCTAGTSSAVNTNPSSYTWTCNGINGGTNASCQATRTTSTSGQCHNFGPGPFAIKPANSSNGCDAGSFANTPPDTQLIWRWSCLGSQGGQNAICTAPRAPAKVNGQCVTYTGVHATQPATGDATGCVSGSYQDLSDTGDTKWKWACLGQNGGTTTNNCVANKAPVCIPTPGTYNEQPASSSATGCTLGNYADVTDSGTQWKWKCDYNGASSQCAAAKPDPRACYRGYWERNDPAHPGGGGVRYTDPSGSTEEYWGIWIDRDEYITYKYGTTPTAIRGASRCN